MNGAAHNSSSNLLFRALVWLQWLVLPVAGGLYAISWNQLPTRLATHFDFNNQPNGWMSREGSVVFTLVFAIIMLITATLILKRVASPDPAAWGVLVLFYVIGGTLLWATDSVIAYNANGIPVNVVPVLIVGMSAAVLVVILALATRRGAQLAPANVLAHETHSSAGFAIFLGVPALAFIILIPNVPIVAVRIALGAAILMMLFGAAMAWSGFHYLFTPAGVEIRTLGFRLRSIPAAEIGSYAINRWSALGGYGIRGVGNRRAYVWGNRGVRIKTQEGEVFLGHSEPERIIRDLDLITNHQGHPSTSLWAGSVSRRS